jgi:alpha-L-rhamnosidase
MKTNFTYTRSKNWLMASLCLGMLFFADAALAQKATWIWYPGDYEVWLGNKMQNRRTERNTFLPPFWKQDSHFVLVEFHKDFNLTAPERVELAVEGQFNVRLDGRAIPGYPKAIDVPAGKHRLSLKVHNQASPPAIYVKGDKVVSDTSWLATFEDKEWIDETGKTSDVSATKYLHANAWDFNEANTLPSAFKLPVEEHKAIKTEKQANGLLVDFGKETFGYIKLLGLKGKGAVTLYYGESREEALATETCELFDKIDIDKPEKGDFTLENSKAFRFVNIRFEGGVSADDASMLYEYSDIKQRGSFRCSDDEVNKIWDVAAYTLHLNTREFFIDGIKRDRWVWSGDAYQSFLMNYYIYFDSPTVYRTLYALRGKDPVTSHVNTIMDYTFYWFLGIYDQYLYSGDKKFIKQIYPAMQSLMTYCLQRRDKDGLMEGLPGDWIFIDWADGLSKKGQVSFEQLLFCRSLETMALCADIMNDKQGATEYKKLGADLKTKLFAYYWNEQKQALVHSRIDGKQTDNVTRYANMFSIFFNYFSEAQKQEVKKSVLLNDKIQKITTPYMRFYELEALCAMNEQSYVLKEMKSYWGGMLKLGATSFWEEYNPTKTGADHYSMYGRPFGKSLCHAWGASPIYLLGKYYLGVKPSSPGYATYTIQPNLGGLKWIEGSVPTADGDIKVFCDTKQIKISGDKGIGTLLFASAKKPVCKQGIIIAKGKNNYELTVEAGKQYVVTYTAVQ